MGTYAVTHIKHKNKIVALSDSYDGYFSEGMGFANMLTIKHMSTELLKKLTDNFTIDIDENEDDEPTIETRQIENALFNFNNEFSDKEAQSWMKKSLEGNISTSVTGVGPLLYLNYNPHYGRDYDYFDYMLDLDKEEFIVYNLTVSFKNIRALTLEKLQLLNINHNKDYLLDMGFSEDILLKLPQNSFENLLEEYMSYEDEVPENSKIKVENYFKELISLNNDDIRKFINDLNNEEDKIQQEHLKTAEENYNKMLEERKRESNNTQIGTEDEMRGYSIYTSNGISASELRKFIVFLDKMTKTYPEIEFMKKNTVWGMDENFQTGGISFFSPKKESQNQDFNIFMRRLEHLFNTRFNIRSSTGIWKYRDEMTSEEDPETDFLGFGTPVVEKTLFDLKTLKVENPELVETMHPWLFFHIDYNEIREEILKLDIKKFSEMTIFFSYFAILYQDIEVLNFIKDEFENQLKNFDDKTKEAVASRILCSIGDSFLIEKAVTNKEDSNISFENYLKESDYIKEISTYMNDLEKSKFLNKPHSPKR